MKKGKKKKKKVTEAVHTQANMTNSDDVVMLGVRMSIMEREKIKMYAVTHHTSIAVLIREYIASLPDPNSP